MDDLEVLIRPGGEILHGAVERLPLPMVQPHGANPDVTCSYYRLPAGKRLSLHVHDERTEVWFLIEGRVEVTLGAGKEIVSAPAAVISPPQTPHRMECLGPDDAIFVNFATPRVQDGPDGRRLGTTELEDGGAGT